MTKPYPDGGDITPGGGSDEIEGYLDVTPGGGTGCIEGHGGG